MEGKIPTMICAALVIAAGISGIGIGYVMFNDTSLSESGDITDAAGRSISAPENLDNGIVTVGVGTLRFISYFNLDEKVISVDAGDVNVGGYNAKGYGYAYDYFLKHRNGEINSHTHNSIGTADVERIGNLQPGLVVVSKTVYDAHKVNCDMIGGAFNMVVIWEPESFIDLTAYKITSEFSAQLDLLGKVLGMEDRANELKTGINNILSDIRSVVGTNVSHEKAYIAGGASAGAQQLNWTMGQYWALEMVNGTNAFTGNNLTMLTPQSVETVAALDANVILIDPASKNLMQTTNLDSQGVLEAYAGKDVRIYVVIPYVWFGINFENVLANAYLLANILYGDTVLSSSGAADKINAVYELFYGSNGSDVHSKMVLFFENNFRPDGTDVIASAGGPLSIGSEYKISGSTGNRTIVPV